MLPTKTNLLLQLEETPSNGEEAENLARNIASGISTHSVALHEVVESLGPSLTHQTPGRRSSGTRLLADILHFLPRETLGQDELSFLASFLIDRLKDQHSVVPSVLYALLAVVRAG